MQHGLEKQFAGSDFLLGIAGSGHVQDELFARLEQDARSDDPLRAATVRGFLEDYVAAEIQPEYRRQVEFVLVTPPDADGNAVQTFDPGMFTKCGRRKWTACIGTGAEFVQRATASYERLGIRLPIASLADLIVAADDAANAANESLTVNDAFLLGVIANGRSYLMGDARITPSHAPPQLENNWGKASERFQVIMRDAQSINRATGVAQSQLAEIRTGSLSDENLSLMRDRSDEIAMSRQGLSHRLSDYFDWYDDLLGRA